MSIYCNSYAQSCTLQCCDVSGYCPSSYSNCYYYYSSYNNTNVQNFVTLTTGPIVGIAVGAVVFLVLVGVGIYFCCRRRKMLAIQALPSSAENTTIIIPGNPQGYAPYQSYGMPNGYPPQGLPYNQPVSYGLQPKHGDGLVVNPM